LGLSKDLANKSVVFSPDINCSHVIVFAG
jgi:hypothetical protein